MSMLPFRRLGVPTQTIASSEVAMASCQSLVAW